VKVGTNAALIAPSANRSRTRFGYAERDDERVHLVAGAEKPGQHLVAAEAEEAARERGDAGNAGVTGESSVTVRRGMSGSGHRVRFHRAGEGNTQKKALAGEPARPKEDG
jgi:hypothetical protein